MTVVLLILKILGILLLVLFALVLFALLLVLFVPVRYRVRGSTRPKLTLTVRVSFLLHAAAFGLDMLPGKNDMYLRILFFKKILARADNTEEFEDTMEETAVKGAEAAAGEAEKAADTFVRGAVAEREEETGTAEDAGTGKGTGRAEEAGRRQEAGKAENAGREDRAGRAENARREEKAGRAKSARREEEAGRAENAGIEKKAGRAENVRREEKAERAKSARSAEEAEGGSGTLEDGQEDRIPPEKKRRLSPKSVSEGILSFFARIRAALGNLQAASHRIFERIRAALGNLRAVFLRILAVAGRIRRILEEDASRQALRFLGGRVLLLLKRLSPRRFDLDLAYSAGAPDKTGELLGVLALFPMAYRQEWKITPDFAADHFYADARFDVQGRVFLFQVLGIALSVLLDKNCRKLYNELKNGS